MLSSLILSLAMSTTPAEMNVNDFNIEEAGTRRGQVRINDQKLDVTEVGTRRGQVRIGTRRGQVRI
jgi:hypothetical protein